MHNYRRLVNAAGEEGTASVYLSLRQKEERRGNETMVLSNHPFFKKFLKIDRNLGGAK